MTLQLLYSEFSYIRGKLSFLFYQWASAAFWNDGYAAGPQTPGGAAQGGHAKASLDEDPYAGIRHGSGGTYLFCRSVLGAGFNCFSGSGLDSEIGSNSRKENKWLEDLKT